MMGKTVLITGGGKGIGRATALKFAGHGAEIILTGRNLSSCQDTAEMARALNPRCKATALASDVSDPQSVAALFEEIATTLPKLDIAFLNAGTGRAGEIVNQTLEDFSHTFSVNCTGMWLCLKHCFKAMRDEGGSIVTNLSVHSKRTIFPGTAAYTASKHAAMALTKSAAVEGAPFGIRVNGVAPGPIMTEMLAASADAIGGIETWEKKIPQKRVGQSEEVASAVLWLAGEQASFVNGAILNVDGGFLAA